MANVEFGTGKTVIILTIVVACFGILWPKIFYPMITAISNKKVDSDSMNGCCDVIFETDVNAIRIMIEMCGTILNRKEDFNPKLSQAFQQGKLTKEVINTCRTEVMNICGIDIAEFLSKKEKLGHSYKQTLDEIRSFNISVCLRHHFGVNPALIGTPRRIRIWGPSSSRHLRQERPLHFRPDIIHPALREKGRAIPQSHIMPKISSDRETNVRSIPLPGMRPPMGGAGHVVPPPKTGGTMSIVMPLYTLGIIIFFVYTVMKMCTKRTGESESFKNFHSDPEFRRVVFSEDYSNGCAGRVGEESVWGRDIQEAPKTWKSSSDNSTRLSWKERDTIMSAITGLLSEVDQQLYGEGDTQTQCSTKLKDKHKLEDPCSEEVQVAKTKALLFTQTDSELSKTKNGLPSVHQDLAEESELDDIKPKVKVMGLELMAECEGGQKWSRPATPNLGVSGSSRPTTPIPPPYSPEPQNIFLEGALPQQSQLLVTDSKTLAMTLPQGEEPEPPVILSSKMTLSLISLDSVLSEDNPQQSQLTAPIQTDAKGEDDNVGSTDSTLFGVNSELMDETVVNEIDSSRIHEQESEAVDTEHLSKNMSEITEKDSLLNYTTATQSEEAEAGMMPELEDTAADVSNLDGLDSIEDQDDFRNVDVVMCNGNAREVNGQQEQQENNPTQQQS